MRRTSIFCLILRATFALASNRSVVIQDRGCVSSFKSALRDFEVCKTKICFVILPEKPHVIPDPEFRSPLSRIFQCLGNNASSGVFFDVLERASKTVPELQNAMCIYGGPNCSFDNSVWFVEDVGKFNTSYRIIAGGFILFLPHRRTQYTIHSHPWLSGKMAVLFRHDRAKTSIESSWKQVIQPFSNAGWSLILGFMCLLCIALGIHVCRFSSVRTFFQLIRWLASYRPSEQRVAEIASWNSLKLAVIVFFPVSVLLYELAYSESSHSDNVSDIQVLKSFGLRNFAIVEGDASEAVFRHAVGWENRKGDVPWVPVKTIDDAISMVRNNSVKFAFSFETAVPTILLCNKMGDSISAITTGKRDYGGWYYGLGIPSKLRQRIDRALGTLALEDLPRKSLKVFETSPLGCRKRFSGLGYKDVLFIFLVTVIPILICHIGSYTLLCCESDIEAADTPKDAESNKDSEPVPDDYVPQDSNSGSSSSQFSQMSSTSKNNSSTSIG